MSSKQARPIIGTMIGDPAGVGPEVIARALASGHVHELSVPVLIGSAAVMKRAIEITRVPCSVRVIRSIDDLSDDPAIVDIVDPGALRASELPLAEDTVRGGEASALWLDEMGALASDGAIAAGVMGPISSGSSNLPTRCRASSARSREKAILSC